MPLLRLTATPPPSVLADLVAGSVASRIAAAALGQAGPGWVGAPRAARPLVGAVEALRDRLRLAGIGRVVLATTGGVGVAAEALGTSPRLIVLDTTDPAQVADALAGDLAATALVLSVPPGGDVAAVLSIRDAFEGAAEGDVAARTVVVAEPGSPLEELPGAHLPGPADVGGAWSALTAYALVPAGLAGADVGVLLADAAAVAADLAADDPGNPALLLGALLADPPPAPGPGGTAVTTVALAGDPGLAEHAGQLLGALGRGPLPVLVEGPGAPGWDGALTVGLGELATSTMVGTAGPAAAQILLWQHTVAVAGHLLGADPTRSARGTAPDVPDGPIAFVDGFVEARAGDWLPAGASTLTGALRALAARGNHLSVHAYLDRESDASAAVLRAELARRTGLPVTFGWAPRCLPGAGRDRGGAVICQLTADPDPDTDPVPDALAQCQASTARADAAALARHGSPVLRLHLTDRVAGLVGLARAVQEL